MRQECAEHRRNALDESRNTHHGDDDDEDENDNDSVKVEKIAEYGEYNDMRRHTNLKILAAFIGCSFGIWGCASKGPITVKEANYPVGQVDARGLFHENCIVCHGENGRAHTFHGRLVGAQNLTDPEWQSETSDAQIVNAIKTGPSVMPAFEKKLSPTEIDALAVYVRSFKQNQ